MTFTSTTIRKLRALNLEQHIFDAVLLIFEEAKEAKPKKKGCAADRHARGTRLADDWVLPAEWRQWALNIGLRPFEVDREARGFHRWALNAKGDKGIKLRWDLTWQNWCERMLKDAGRQPMVVNGAGPAAPAEGPETFTDATWRAIAKRYKQTGHWNPEWGSSPDRMDCKMPDAYL
jgi:hypothetical protein